MAALLGLPATAHAQIVAPAGRTLFNRTVMIRSFVRIDNFDEDMPGHHVRQFVNPYAIVWGAYPNLNLTFVAPLVIVQSRNPSDPGQNFTHASFADGSIFARYDLMRKNVARGYTRLSPEIGVKVPSGGLFSTGSTTRLARSCFHIGVIRTRSSLTRNSHTPPRMIKACAWATAGTMTSPISTACCPFEHSESLHFTCCWR